MKTISPTRNNRQSRPAFTLVELMIVLTIMTVMMSFAAPSFHRTIHQTNIDAAAVTLRTVWTAQRLYWLENRVYSTDLATLDSEGLVDPNVLVPLNGYTFYINSADADGFNATATLTGSGKWTGQLTITEAGTVSGAIQASGEADITPGVL